MKNHKIPYLTPNLERVQLDNGISLALESAQVPWSDPLMNSGLGPEVTSMDMPITTLPM